MNTRKTKLVNIPVGSRFIHPSHSTLMIATDVFMIEPPYKKRMCVSESGLAEWINTEKTYERFDKTITYKFQGLSLNIVKQHVNDLSLESLKTGFKITLAATIGSPIVKQTLNVKTWNILRNYVGQEIMDNGVSNASDVTLADVADKINVKRLGMYRGCGHGTITKIVNMLKLADDNTKQPVI